MSLIFLLKIASVFMLPLALWLWCLLELGGHVEDMGWRLFLFGAACLLLVVPFVGILGRL